jgi:hypothetical protein
MGWERIGEAGGFALYIHNADPIPPGSVILPSGGSDSECEQQIVFPCLQKKPEPAAWMLSWADCNCDPEADEADPKVTSCCHACLAALLDGLEKQEVAECGGCGLLFRPGKAMVADVVEL